MARLALLLLILLANTVAAQPVDRIIGKKRSRVQQDLREFRILDYQRDRVEYAIGRGVRQTVIFKNDTCTTFFWAVTSEQVPSFIDRLTEYGYVLTSDSLLVREGVTLRPTPLESGRAVLFSASVDGSYNTAVLATSAKPTGKGKTTRGDEERTRGPIVLPLPLMQQLAILEDADTTAKVKDPTRNWVGGKDTEVKLLGY